MYGYIYKSKNLVNNRIYIGKKKSSHFIPDYFGSGIVLKQALKLYGKTSFKVELLAWAIDLKSINLLERYYIDFFKKSSEDNLLYNISPGGDGGALRGSGFRLSNTTIQKIKAAKQGHIVSEETKKKLRSYNLGRHLSKETKLKMSLTHKNRWNSLCAEDLSKISSKFTGSQNPFYGKKHKKESKLKMSLAKLKD